MAGLKPGWALHRLRQAAWTHEVDRRKVHWRRVLHALGVSVLVALVLFPLAALWGVRNASIDDYLGPQRTTYQATYTGQIDLDLGPLGHAYLPNTFVPKPLRFLGLSMKVHGMSGTQASSASLFSTKTLKAYVQVYKEPTEVMKGPLRELVGDIVVQTLGAEAVLLLVWAAWLLRRFWLSPRVADALRPRWVVVGYLVVVLVGGGAVVAPPSQDQQRIPVTLNTGTVLDHMTVDNELLATVLNRGISGLQLLADRQEAAVTDYVQTATDHFVRQMDELARPAPTETLMVGYSDLHCSIAMVQILSSVITTVRPNMVIDSGDDTNQGAAWERPCLVRERAAAGGLPLVVASGNHDSETTDEQEKSLGFTTLDGKVLKVGDTTVLGDDDPEVQIPFSVNRRKQRNETEAQMGQRLLEVARKADGVDIMLVHQPDAAAPITAAPNPPANLIMWGHMHHQVGPTVIHHTDGSWTVALQCGTAGGKKQPTLTEYSTPYTPPRTSADIYLFFTDIATGLITGVQPLHFLPSGQVVIDPRIPTGDLAQLPPATHARLADGHPSATPSGEGE